METINERIRQYCDFRGYDVADFLSQVKMEDGRLDTRNVRVLALRYPDLNKEWLLSGKGNMINENYADKPLIAAQGERFKELLAVMEQRGIITNQKDLATKLDYNKSYFSHLVNNRVLTADVCNKLKSLVPDLNTEYLMSGFGTLLVAEQTDADAHAVAAPLPHPQPTDDGAYRTEIIRRIDKVTEELSRHGEELARQGEELARQGDRLTDVISLLKSALTAQSVQNPCNGE